MSAPDLFLGRRARAALLRAEAGATDDGQPFRVVAQPNPVAPAGARGECVFRTLHLGLTHSAGTTLRVTPVVDGAALAGEAVDIVLAALAEPVTETFEIALSRAMRIGGVEIARQDLVGTWFTVRLETVGERTEGDLGFERLEVEYALIREGRTEVN